MSNKIEKLATIKHNHILATLIYFNYQQIETAKSLNISISKLERWIRKHKIKMEYRYE